MRYELIAIDLDGVLANFTKAAAEVHNIELPSGILDYGFLYSKFESKGDFWKKCHSHDFWASIPKYPWSDELVSIIAKSGNPFIFLTQAPMGTGAWSGKAAWIQKHFGKYQNRLWIVREDKKMHTGKSLVAGPNRLLIDDKDKNIMDWFERGGQGFQWCEMTEDCLDKAEAYLGKIKELVS